MTAPEVRAHSVSYDPETQWATSSTGTKMNLLAEYPNLIDRTKAGMAIAMHRIDEFLVAVTEQRDDDDPEKQKVILFRHESNDKLPEKLRAEHNP